MYRGTSLSRKRTPHDPSVGRCLGSEGAPPTHRVMSPLTSAAFTPPKRCLFHKRCFRLTVESEFGTYKTGWTSRGPESGPGFRLKQLKPFSLFPFRSAAVNGALLQTLLSPELTALSPPEREFLIDNLLVRIYFIIVMIRWTGLAPWESGFPFPCSLTSTVLGFASI